MYDQRRCELVRFGGFDAGAARLSSATWAWDGTRWSERHPAHAPSPRANSAAAYDAKAGRLVLYGGTTQVGLPPTVGHATDTWTWDGVDWTQMTAAGTPDVEVAQAVYSVAGEQVLLLGWHFDLVNGNNSGPQAWAWAGSGWSQLPSGPPGLQFALGYDARAAGVILFGGHGQRGWESDTWAFNGSSWSQLKPPTTPQVHNRTLGSLLADPSTHQLLFIDAVPASGAMWTWTGTDWMKLAVQPPAVNGLAAVEDTDRSRILLIGAEAANPTAASSSRRAETSIWSWDGRAWQRAG